MKLVMVILSALSIVGCSFLGGRKVASKPNCQIEKHPKKNWYRLRVFDRPMSDKWHTKKKVQADFNRYKASGRCV